MKIIWILLLILGGPVLAEVSVERPKHHTEDGFQNYPLTPEAPSFSIGFYLHRVWQSFFLPDVPEEHSLSEEQALNQFESLKGKDTLTWIGQSTFLIRIDGRIILTDPFFSEYAGPYSMGPRRFVKPGISIENLPLIDVMVISHNHYDHLDDAFIEALPNKEGIHVFVPLGLKAFFSERGYSRIHELDWYENARVNDLQITALPAVHYSGRGLADKNKSLWCSWSIDSPSGRYYFLGDSAYSPELFGQIGAYFNSFNLAMLPIGTYGNRKYGVNNHTTPEEAVSIGMEINAKVLVGIHWGTIEMSDESPWEPPERFKAATKKTGVSAERAWVMKIGETRTLPAVGISEFTSETN